MRRPTPGNWFDMDDAGVLQYETDYHGDLSEFTITAHV